MRPLPSSRRGVRLAALVSCLAAVGGLARPARTQAIGQGFELERAGQLDRAASLYFAVLRADPANLSALLGLERVLPPLSRLGELVPVAQRALAAGPPSAALHGILVRTYVGLRELDSAQAVALHWAADAPRDEEPYREWAIALEDTRRHDAARDVLLRGRRAIGRPQAFAIELAELYERAADWERAAAEWATALVDAPGQLPNATSELAETPAPRRDAVARLLTAGEPPPRTRQLAAALLLTWGQPRRAWTVFAPSVAMPTPEAVAALRQFADLAAAQGSTEASRARGLALARLATLVPEPLAARARADAARAFLEGGDQEGARQALAQLAADTSAPADAQALGQGAVIETLIDDGQLAAARDRLARDVRLTPEDRAALRLRLVRRFLTSGDLDGAEQTLDGDSTVDALALGGWIALYRGRVADAERLFRAAGPYAGDRRDATERTAMLALLEQLPGEAFPELGRALLLLARGDSGAALAALRRAADQLGAGGRGRSDLLLLAGRVAARLGRGQRGTALALFDEIVRTAGSGAAAPAAELEWARLLLADDQRLAATQHLEHLILSYPGSAVVPEARRELERAKGAIPKS
jgi:tetratricopeptide (TPR) repeat protein